MAEGVAERQILGSKLEALGRAGKEANAAPAYFGVETGIRSDSTSLSAVLSWKKGGGCGIETTYPL